MGEITLEQAVQLAGAFVAGCKLQADQRTAGEPVTVEPTWLTLSGVPGCGKTMLANAAFAEVQKYNPGNASLWVRGNGPAAESNRRPRAVWMNATQFADAVRGDFKLPEYLAADYLVMIDDVGASRDTTNFIADALYRLCNARLGKWTIFTTNFSLAEIAKQIDERVTSRLIRDGNVFHRINAGDYAMRRKS